MHAQLLVIILQYSHVFEVGSDIQSFSLLYRCQLWCSVEAASEVSYHWRSGPQTHTTRYSVLPDIP